MKAKLISAKHLDRNYPCLVFTCPGCAELHGNFGLKMLPVNTTVIKPAWEWDGSLDQPTLQPSIRTRGKQVCHSFLKKGIFEYLHGCAHSLAGQYIPLPELPEMMHSTKGLDIRPNVVMSLVRGDWTFGCDGYHHGNGTRDCPRAPHHHHDEFCIRPRDQELFAAGIYPSDFRPKTRGRVLF